MAGEGSGGTGCCVTNTTAALVAQGTIAGLLLAGLVWLGVSILGLLVMWLLIWLLFGIWWLVFGTVCTIFCPSCDVSGGSPGGGPCQPCPPCCDPCEPCDECCDPCQPCDGCCGGGAGCGDCGCGDCGCGDCGSCDCSCDSGGGGGSSPSSGGGGGSSGGGGDCGCLVPRAAMIAGSAVATRRGIRKRDLAHHPDTPEYAHDVYVVRGHRLCIGCFTTYPVFLLVATALFLLKPSFAWGTMAGVGGALALMQVVSSAGFARQRAVKATVKTSLGAGLALFVYATLVSGLPFVAQYAMLGGALSLSLVSAIPRRLRMQRRHARTHKGTPCADTALAADGCEEPRGAQ